MRKQVRIASAMHAAVAMLAFFGALAPSGAAENPYTTELKQLRHQMQELAVEARNYELQKFYCLPPYAPAKLPDQMMIDAFKARAKALNDKYVSLKHSFIAFNNANTNQQGRDRLNDYDPTTDQFWNDSIYNKTREWMHTTVNGKAVALAAKRERNCAPVAPPKKEIEVIGGNPPVESGPGIQLPAVEVRDVEIPPVPARFCSEAEKQATLKQFWDVNWSFYMNYQDAREYEAAIGSALRENRGNKAALAALLPGASAATKRHAKANEDVLNAYDRAKAMPVENCGGETKKEVGALPGNTLGASVEVAGAVGEVTIPEKPYLSIEDGGGLILGVVEHERTADVAAMMLALTYNLDFMPNVDFTGVRRQVWRATMEYYGYDFSVRSDGGSITTTTEGVGIPGTGDPSAANPAGVFLANPAFNDVTDIAFSHHSEVQSLEAGIELQSQVSFGRVDIGLKVGYQRRETSDTLSANIAGFLTDLRYRTDVETTGGSLLGTALIHVPLGLVIDYEATALEGFSVDARVEGGAYFLDADGADRFDLNGFISDTQRVRVSASDTTFGFRVGASLNYSPVDALIMSLGFEYSENDTHAVPKRSGQTGEQTTLDFETEETYLGVVRTTFTF